MYVALQLSLLMTRPTMVVHSPIEQCCCMPLSAADFFADVPWLNVPNERRGEILIEPLYPRGGLLGGSPAQSGAKTSKLAALAAARKKKENEKQKGLDSQESNTSVTLLGKLSNRARNEDASEVKRPTGSGSGNGVAAQAQTSSTIQPRKYPKLRRGSSHAAPPSSEALEGISLSTGTAEHHTQETVTPSIPTAVPSTFATTMFGPLSDPQPSFVESFQSLSLSLPQYPDADTKRNPFAGPSPDDIVTKAQSSSKGSARKAEAR